MTDTRPLLALAVAGLLVTAGCAGDGSGTATDRTLTVSATGSATATADRVTVTLAVTGLGPNTTVANRSMRAELDRTREAVRSATDGASVRVAGYEFGQRRRDCYPVRLHDGGSDARVDTEQSAAEPGDIVAPRPCRSALRVHTALVEVRTTANRTTALVGVAEASEWRTVRRVRFRLSDRRRRATAERAIATAVDAARAEADLTANATGLAVVEATDVEVVGNASREASTDAASDRAEATADGAATVTVRRRVVVTYAAQPAEE